MSEIDNWSSDSEGSFYDHSAIRATFAENAVALRKKIKRKIKQSASRLTFNIAGGGNEVNIDNLENTDGNVLGPIRPALTVQLPDLLNIEAYTKYNFDNIIIFNKKEIQKVNLKTYI